MNRATRHTVRKASPANAPAIEESGVGNSGLSGIEKRRHSPPDGGGSDVPQQPGDNVCIQRFQQSYPTSSFIPRTSDQARNRGI